MKTKLYKKINASKKNFDELCLDAQFNINYQNTLYNIVDSLSNGGRIYICGNGGSASDSNHWAAEFVCKIGRERPSIPAESLCSDIATITAIANDFGYKYVFSRQLESKATKKDIVIGITTSGNSENIIEAFKTTEALRILLTGPNKQCTAAKYSDIILSVPGNSTDQIQELHEIIFHSMVYDLEEELFFKEN